MATPPKMAIAQFMSGAPGLLYMGQKLQNCCRVSASHTTTVVSISLKLTYECPHAPHERYGVDGDAPFPQAEGASFRDGLGHLDASPQNRADREHVALQQSYGHQGGDGVEGCWRADVDETEDEGEASGYVDGVDGCVELGVDLQYTSQHGRFEWHC